MRLLPFIIVSQCLSVIIPARVQSQDSLNLYNAYYLAKAIANKDFSVKKSTDTLKRIVGGTLWYATNEVQNVSEIDALLLKTKPYKVLHARLEWILRGLYSQVSLLELTDKQIGKLSNEPLKQKIMKLRADVMKFESQRDPASLQLITGRLNLLQDELVKRKDSLTRLVFRQRLDTSGFEAARFQQLIAEQDTLVIVDSIEITRDEVDNLKTIEVNYQKAKDDLQKIKLSPAEIAQVTGVKPGATASEVRNLADNAVTGYNSSVINYTNLTGAAASGSFRLPDQSQIIDAMAIYLVKRVKQESVLWFFETLQRDMKAFELVHTCFPNCFELLQSNKVYEVPKMGSLWRYAISKDFALMPYNIFNSEWIQKKLGSNKVLLEGLQKAWRVAQLIQQKYTFRDIVSTLYTEMPVAESNAPSATITINTLVSMLYCLNEEFYKMNNNSLMRLQFNDLVHMTDSEFEIMLSLIDMKYNYVFRTLLLRDASELNLAKTARLSLIRKWLGGILVKVDRMDKLREEKKRDSPAAGDDEKMQFQYNDYNTWKFLKELLSTINFNNMPSAEAGYFKKWDSRITKIITAMSDVQEVFQLLEQKNFAGSVNRIFNIVDSLLPHDRIEMTKEDFKKRLEKEKVRWYDDAIRYMHDPATQKRYGFTLVNNTVVIAENSPLNFVSLSKDKFAINIIQKLAGFLNDVAYAQNSRELSKVIEAYAMPAGSYKKKRASWLSFDLNAYLGLYSGFEKAKLKSINGNDSVTSSGGVYGLTAPIGFTLSKTFGKKLSNTLTSEEISGLYSQNPELVKLGRKNRWVQSKFTVSAFVSIIDIGAVVSYRFTSNEETLPQAVKWDQVLSPGIHLNVGIPRTPLVFAAGYQYTPKLRKLKGLTADQQLNAGRMYAAILFDLPMFNFYTKSISVAKK